MRYYIVLLLTFGFSYNAMGASSSSTPDGFETGDSVVPKFYVPTSYPDLWLLARDVSKTIDPERTFLAAAQQMAINARNRVAIERSTPEGYRRWIHASASTMPPTPPFPDDGLGVDDYGRTREQAQEFYLAAAIKAEKAKKETEAYRHKILYAAWKAAEEERKEEANAEFYRHQMLASVDKILFDSKGVSEEKNRQLIYAAWLRAQRGASRH